MQPNLKIPPLPLLPGLLSNMTRNIVTNHNLQLAAVYNEAIKDISETSNIDSISPLVPRRFFLFLFFFHIKEGKPRQRGGQQMEGSKAEGGTMCV